MSWFNVDDRMHQHDKVLDLCSTSTGRQAMGLWVVAGSWAAGSSQEVGEVSARRCAALGFTAKHSSALVEAGLWERTSSGFRFHDWDEWQSHHVKQSKERALAADRKRKQRQRDDEMSRVTERDVTGPSPGTLVPSQAKPNQTKKEPLTPAEQVQSVWASASGHTIPSAVVLDATPKQSDALLRMWRWSEGDMLRLHVRLVEMRCDAWVAKQPIHIWADRIGIAPAAVVNGSATAPVDYDYSAPNAGGKL